MKYIKIFLIIFLTFLFPNFSQAQTLKMGYIEFPPVFFTDAQKTPKGIVIDLASKIIPEAGYNFEASSYPIKRLCDYLAKGKLDLWIGLKTLPELKDTTIKGKSEILKITLNAYTVKKLPDIKTKEDLIYKSIIIIRGFSYGGWINFIKDPKNQIAFIETEDHRAAFRMLKAKRADYLLGYENPSKKALKDFKLTNLKQNTISSFGAYFVISKKTPDAENVLLNLENTYKKLKKSGKL
jgi:polar amino acid transport system substrate-binding protein